MGVQQCKRLISIYVCMCVSERERVLGQNQIILKSSSSAFFSKWVGFTCLKILQTVINESDVNESFTSFGKVVLFNLTFMSKLLD